MRDPRYEKLAHLLVNYSCEAKAGDKVLIEAIDIPSEFTCDLVRAVRKAGAIPLVKLDSNTVKRTMLQEGSEEGWRLLAEMEGGLMKQVQCYIAVRGVRMSANCQMFLQRNRSYMRRSFTVPCTSRRV